jgi:hypothetical protein
VFTLLNVPIEGQLIQPQTLDRKEEDEETIKKITRRKIPNYSQDHDKKSNENKRTKKYHKIVDQIVSGLKIIFIRDNCRSE